MEERERRVLLLKFRVMPTTKKTHNLEGLILELKQLHIVDRDELKAILKLSDYGRLGGYVFKVIGSTRWSTVMAKGKYIIAALRKERTGNG